MVSQGDKIQVAVRIPLRQKAELEREAVERGVSKSEYIRSILADRHQVAGHARKGQCGRVPRALEAGLRNRGDRSSCRSRSAPRIYL